MPRAKTNLIRGDFGYIYKHKGLGVGYLIIQMYERCDGTNKMKIEQR